MVKKKGNKELGKILEHAIKLYFVSEKDRMLLGDKYVEFGERSLKIIDPATIIHSTKTNKGERIYGKSILDSEDGKKSLFDKINAYDEAFDDGLSVKDVKEKVKELKEIKEARQKFLKEKYTDEDSVMDAEELWEELIKVFGKELANG